ncbi:MAG: hypothetical protein IT376_09970 [Polyangiaceae bacterium]|nr:hypothetical protein [Polyangiaceae bacterium]
MTTPSRSLEPTRRWRAAGALLALLFLAVSCGEEESSSGGGGGAGGRGPDNTGQSCEAATDCYPSVDAGALAGEVQCLDRVEDGYCTHLCETDADCCAVDGECKTGLRQVCSPFESTGQKMCFLSCEAADLVAPDGGWPDDAGADETLYCQREAGSAFTCRSTGGGAANRKVCLP